MPETLPGNPTDAGPDTRRDEPPPDVKDLMIYAEDISARARRDFGLQTVADRRAIVTAIDEAIERLQEARYAACVR